MQQAPLKSIARHPLENHRSKDGMPNDSEEPGSSWKQAAAKLNGFHSSVDGDTQVPEVQKHVRRNGFVKANSNGTNGICSSGNDASHSSKCNGSLRSQEESIVKNQTEHGNGELEIPRSQVKEFPNPIVKSKEKNLRTIPKNFVEHVRLVFSQEDDFFCYLCLRCPFRTEYETLIFEEHVPCHLIKSKHKCPACTFSSDVAQVVLDHISEIHSPSYAKSKKFACLFENIFSCDHCPFQCNFEEEFSDHLVFHSESSRYHCSLCSFSAAHQKTVVDHESLHFKSQPFFVDGIAKVPRRYQTQRDKTPKFFSVGQQQMPERPVMAESMNEEDRKELIGKLAEIVDPQLLK